MDEILGRAASAPLITFEGQWIEMDKVVINQAILTVESKLDVHPLRQPSGTPWTCEYIDREEDTYIASRRDLDNAISADSIAELRCKLLDLVGAVSVF